ncbi:MAG: hypothetical protein IH899_15800 [Planctomycetes bacterium]|nr:hypothetical protein [Planctomycetota bacterium]
MHITADLESKIEIVNRDAVLSDQAVAALAWLLIAMADVESEDAQENMEVAR